jgi:hypothetical protein
MSHDVYSWAVRCPHPFLAVLQRDVLSPLIGKPEFEEGMYGMKIQKWEMLMIVLV